MTQPTTRLGRLEVAAERARKRAVAAREEAEKAEAVAKAKRRELASAEAKAAAWRRGACLRALGLAVWRLVRSMEPVKQAAWINALAAQDGLSAKTSGLIREALSDASFDGRDRSLGKGAS